MWRTQSKKPLVNLRTVGIYLCMDVNKKSQKIFKTKKDKIQVNTLYPVLESLI